MKDDGKLYILHQDVFTWENTLEKYIVVFEVVNSTIIKTWITQLPPWHRFTDDNYRYYVPNLN